MANEYKDDMKELVKTAYKVGKELSKESFSVDPQTVILAAIANEIHNLSLEIYDLNLTITEGNHNE